MKPAAPKSTWVETAQTLMQVSYQDAKKENFDESRWVVGDGVAQFKARTKTVYDPAAKTKRIEDSAQWVAWMRFHRAEGRRNYEAVARSNLSADSLGRYWPVPAEYPPPASSDFSAAAE